MLNRVSKTIYADQIQYSDNIGYYYDYAHNVGSDDILVGVFDNSGKLMNTNGLFEKIDDNTLRIFFPTNYGIQWTAYVFYEDGDILLTAPKKRLFEQDTINAADLNNYLDYRLAMGREGRPTYNVTLEDFKTWCQAQLDSSLYLLKANNLSDLNDVAIARNNLDVYSKSDVDTMAGNLMSVGGFVDAVSSITPLGIVLTTQNRIIDFGGVNIVVSFSISSTYSDSSVFYIDLTPKTGITLDIPEQVFPIYGVCSSPVSTKVGQLTMTSSTVGGAERCVFNLTMVPSGTTECTAAFHINVNKA